MEARTLFLHIGQTKTGSKWIQKIFSLNAPILKEHGIEYPIPNGEKTASQQINTFETNAQQLFSVTTPVQTFLPESWKDQSDSLLLSAEVIFESIVLALNESPGKIEQELEYIRSLGFTEIHFLLLIRSPVERIVSRLNQRIKMGIHDSMPDENHYQSFALESSFRKVSQFLDFLENRPDCTLTLLNYEAIKNDIITALGNWLKLPSGALKSPEVSRINRSLTYQELYTLTRIKGSGRSNIPSIGFNWIRELPDLEVKKIYPSADIQEMIWQINEPYLKRINSILPEDQQLLKKLVPESVPPEKLVFDPRQLDILIHYLSHSPEMKIPESADIPIKRTILQKVKYFLNKPFRSN